MGRSFEAVFEAEFASLHRYLARRVGGAAEGRTRDPPAQRLGRADRRRDRRRARSSDRDGQVASLTHAREAAEPVRRDRATSGGDQMIDELLNTFRSEVAQPDRETAERIFALATRSATRRRHTTLGFRPRLALGVAVAALVLVPTAVAFGGKLADLFEGTPAPPDVSTAFAESNRMADKVVQQGFAAQWPHADVSKAHGVIEIQTPDGPEDLWAAPDDLGGQCSFI